MTQEHLSREIEKNFFAFRKASYFLESYQLVLNGRPQIHFRHTPFRKQHHSVILSRLGTPWHCASGQSGRTTKRGGGEICKAKAAVPASPPSSNKGRGKAKRKLNIVAADESRQQFSPEETGVAGEMTAVADNIERLGVVTLESKWRTVFLREGQPRVAKDSYVFKERPLVVVRYEEEPAL